MSKQEPVNNKALIPDNSIDHGELKRYAGPGMMARWQTELAILQRLGDQLPLPTLLPHDADAEILMNPLKGLPAVMLINESNSAELFRSLGCVLRSIQKVPVQKLQNSIRGTGDVIVHGDFSLQTVIFSSAPHSVEAIIGWEWANIGDRISDLAWFEWYVRMQMGKYARDLPNFFEAYGSTPAWSERKEAMIQQVNRRLEFARMASEKRVIQFWQNSLQFTSRLQAL